MLCYWILATTLRGWYNYPHFSQERQGLDCQRSWWWSSIQCLSSVHSHMDARHSPGMVAAAGCPSSNQTLRWEFTRANFTGECCWTQHKREREQSRWGRGRSWTAVQSQNRSPIWPCRPYRVVLKWGKGLCVPKLTSHWMYAAAPGAKGRILSEAALLSWQLRAITKEGPSCELPAVKTPRRWGKRILSLKGERRLGDSTALLEWLFSDL